MYNSYKFKKYWSSFWQRYNLRSQFRNIKKLFLFLFVVWLLGSLLTILSQTIFYPEDHKTIESIFQYFWIVIIMLVSGFDIQGEQLHLVSRIVSVIMLFMGIIVVGLFTGQIISVFLHVLKTSEYVPEKPPAFRFKNPLIICGINDKLFNIVRYLRSSPFSQNREIITSAWAACIAVLLVHVQIDFSVRIPSIAVLAAVTTAILALSACTTRIVNE